MSSGGGGGGASEKAVNPGSSAGTDKEKMIRNLRKVKGRGWGVGERMRRAVQLGVCLETCHQQSADKIIM